MSGQSRGLAAVWSFSIISFAPTATGGKHGVAKASAQGDGDW
ncbi:MAG: hypothetical protein ACLP0J_09075 [Solirubrobacteraceae bacterium]